MKDKRTQAEKLQDYEDCVDAIEALKEFCVTDKATGLIGELEDELKNYYEVR